MMAKRHRGCAPASGTLWGPREEGLSLTRASPVLKGGPPGKGVWKREGASPPQQSGVSTGRQGEVTGQCPPDQALRANLSSGLT